MEKQQSNRLNCKEVLTTNELEPHQTLFLGWKKQQSNRLNCKEVLHYQWTRKNDPLFLSKPWVLNVKHRSLRRFRSDGKAWTEQPLEPETPPRLAVRLVLLRLVPGVEVLAEVIVAVAEELRQRPRTIQPGDRLVQGGDVAPDVEAVVLHLEGSKSNSYTLLHNLRIKYFSISLEYLNKIN